MTVTINGCPKEIAELMSALQNGTEIKTKKPYFPPLIEELTEDEKIKKFSDEVSHALNKMNEVAKQRKENAPQAETAEQSDNVGIAKQSIDNLRKMISEKTAEFFEEYVNAVSSATDDYATFNYCFYLRQSAYKMWEMLSKSVIANIWNIDTLFF